MSLESLAQDIIFIYNFVKQDEMFWKLFFAWSAGALGSAAYFAAAYFNFVTESKVRRDQLLRPFLKRYSSHEISPWKFTCYVFVGGSIALIFQVDVPTFVPVQSLILGATWPAVISQFLSGKMTDPIPEEIENLKGHNKAIDDKDSFSDYRT